MHSPMGLCRARRALLSTSGIVNSLRQRFGSLSEDDNAERDVSTQRPTSSISWFEDYGDELLALMSMPGASRIVSLTRI